TDQQREGPHIIRTLVPRREELPCRRRMAVEVRHRPTIRTPERMLRPDKARARALSGAAHMCRTETRALPRVITPPRMEQWPGFQGHKVEKPRLQARPGGTVPRQRLPTAICMPGTTVT